VIRRVLDGLYLGAGWAAGFFLVMVFLLMMALALGRLPFFRLNIPSGDEFAAWSMAAMAFLGLAHTFKSGEMIRVGLLLERLHGTRRWVAEIVALGISAAFIVYFAWHAIQLTYFSWLLNDMASGVVPVPLWIPQLGFSGGLVILAIAVLDELVRVLRGLRPSYEKEPPASPEELVARIADGSV
jgi:TRAP-type C4-dicarboxylate transport system permease small subunit